MAAEIGTEIPEASATDGRFNEAAANGRGNHLASAALAAVLRALQ